MKFIVLKDTEKYTIYECGDCRAIKTHQDPLHLCVTGYTKDNLRPPTKIELDTIIKELFSDENHVEIPNIRMKMFSNDTIHVWEDNKFTKELMNTRAPNK